MRSPYHLDPEVYSESWQLPPIFLKVDFFIIIYFYVYIYIYIFVYKSLNELCVCCMFLFIQALNVESSLLRIGFWPLQEYVDPWLPWHSTKLLLKVCSKAQAGGWPMCTCIASIRTVQQSEGSESWARTRGGCAEQCGLWCRSCCARFPLHLFLYIHFLYAPVCVRSKVCLGCLKDQAPDGLLLDTETAWTLRISTNDIDSPK